MGFQHWGLSELRDLGASERLREWIVLPLLIGVWMFIQPYIGITHDGLLYTAQALNRLHPDIYALDVFFKYGSQDDYTVFSPLYAWGIDSLGIERAAFLFTFVSKLIWFAALVWMARGLLSGLWLPLGIALVVALTPFYDNDAIFAYGESFVTARPLSEAFGMFALGWLVRGRPVLAMMATLPALMLHPLMGLPVLLVMILSWIRKPALQLVAVVVALSVAILVMMLSSENTEHILFRVFTQDWYAIINGRTPEVLLHNWTPHGWARVVWISALWWTAYQYGDSLEKKLGRTLLFTVAGAFLVAWLAGSISQNVFFTQLQLWRVLWIGQLLGFLILARMLPRLWSENLHSKLQAGVLLLALFLADVPRIIFLVAATPLIFLVQRKLPYWKPARVHYALLGLLVFIVLYPRLEEIIDTMFLILPQEGKARLPIFSKEPLVLFMALVFLSLFLRRRSEKLLVGIFSIGVAILCLSLMFWGQGYRTFALATEENQAYIREVQSKIPQSAVVFWEEGLPQTWLLLQRAYYASHRQNAGALISKTSALEISRRMKRLLDAGFSEGEPKKRETLLKNRKKHTAEDVLYLCADPPLDFVIMSQRVSLQHDMQFKLHLGRRVSGKPRFAEYYLYQCDRLRTAR